MCDQCETLMLEHIVLSRKETPGGPDLPCTKRWFYGGPCGLIGKHIHRTCPKCNRGYGMLMEESR